MLRLRTIFLTRRAFLLGWSIVLFLVLAPRDSDRARFESHLSDRGPGR